MRCIIILFQNISVYLALTMSYTYVAVIRSKVQCLPDIQNWSRDAIPTREGNYTSRPQTCKHSGRICTYKQLGSNTH